MPSRLTPGPSDGLYRAARGLRPFDFPAPPSPLPPSSEPVIGGNRWDDPKGSVGTLYCATSAEAAFAEVLAPFRERPGLLDRIRESIQSPDDQYEFKLMPGEVPLDFLAALKIGHARVDPSSRFVDVDHPDTHAELSARLHPLLNTHGLRYFDRGVVMSQDRRLTRPVARHYYELSLTHDHTELCGLRYESRLSADWECWALWESAPLLLAGADVEPVTWENPDLRSAASKLSLKLPF